MRNAIAIIGVVGLLACESKTSTMSGDLAMTAGGDLAMTAGGDLAMMTSGDLAMMTSGDLAGPRDLAMTSGDLAMAGTIPDPGSGTKVNSNFDDTEPNNTPAQAVPLGIAGSNTVYLWVNNNSIGGSDTADYFVFKTGGTAGELALYPQGICWSGGTNLVDATLWTVSGGQQVLPPVHEWKSTSTTCEVGAMSDAPLAANTTYLLGIFSVSGTGNYFA